MGSHVWSPKQMGFYAVLLQERYIATNTWPSDAVEITDQVWAEFAYASPPTGKMLGSDPVTGQPTWIDRPPPPPPTLAQQADAMLAAGIAIISVSNPGLDGTYSCSLAASAEETGLLSAINAGLELPNGVATRVDTSGQPHDFTPEEFKTYCQAKLTYQQALQTISGTNQGTLPTQPTVIP